MNKKEILKVAASVLVVGVTATTAMYVTKHILVNSISKRTGTPKEELKEKNVIELYKIKRDLPPEIKDERGEQEPKGVFAALQKAIEKTKTQLSKNVTANG